MGRAGNSNKAVSTIAQSAARRRGFPEPRTPSSYERFLRDHLHMHVLDTDQGVRDLVDGLAALRPSHIALDFETASKNGRWGSLNGSIRLIQIGVSASVADDNTDRQYLIDCHAADPSPVVTLLQDPGIEKLIHYMDFEVEWAAIHLGAEIRNVFDTCAAWAVIQRKLKGLPLEEAQKLLPGWERHNNKLVTLIDRYLGIELPKDGQTANWGARDLPNDQLVYAGMDVAVLEPLAQLTKQVVEQVGVQDGVRSRMGWLRRKVLSRTDDINAPLHDDAARLMGSFRRAADTDEIDALWRSSRQLSLAASNRARLYQEYLTLREQLATKRSGEGEGQLSLAML